MPRFPRWSKLLLLFQPQLHWLLNQERKDELQRIRGAIKELKRRLLLALPVKAHTICGEPLRSDGYCQKCLSYPEKADIFDEVLSLKKIMQHTDRDFLGPFGLKIKP